MVLTAGTPIYYGMSSRSRMSRLQASFPLTHRNSSNPECGIWYRRVTEVGTNRSGKRIVGVPQQAPRKRRKTGRGSAPRIEDSDESDVGEDIEDEVHDFRRVQIVHKETPVPAISSLTPGGPSCNTLQGQDTPFILKEDTSFNFEQAVKRFSAVPFPYSSSSRMQGHINELQPSRERGEPKTHASDALPVYERRRPRVKTGCTNCKLVHYHFDPVTAVHVHSSHAGPALTTLL